MVFEVNMLNETTSTQFHKTVFLEFTNIPNCLLVVRYIYIFATINVEYIDSIFKNKYIYSLLKVYM